jgi:hypothetical protein
MQVKEGRLDYSTEVVPTLETLMDEVEDLLNKSELPDTADVEYWNQFICDTIERELFLSEKKDQ